MSNAKKIALITGANKGIGFEIARQLGEQGIAVLIGARDQARGEEAAEKLRADGLDARFVQLDVTDQRTIDAAVSAIEKGYGKLDVLVNNAAISLPEARTAPSTLPIDALRKIYDTNVFGVFAVTQAMLPLLRKSDAGRIVNMSSHVGILSVLADPNSQMPSYVKAILAYNSSKTAVNAITVAFANELRETSIKVNAVSPGYVATDLNGHSGWLTPEQGAKVPVKYATLPADGPTGGFFDENGVVAW